VTEPAVTADEVNTFLADQGDFTRAGPIVVDSVTSESVTVRWTYDDSVLRPGGYIAGPTLFTIADVCGWVLTFLSEGITPMAVTWDLHITFLRPAIGGDVIGVGRLLKRGKSLIYGDVEMYIAGDPEKPVAHATVTYALPKG
jgi:uncharacterized protein (TIGR00369 family)